MVHLSLPATDDPPRTKSPAVDLSVLPSTSGQKRSVTSSAIIQKPKPRGIRKAEVSYLVQTSSRRWNIWNMTGMFQEKTLVSLVHELQLQHPITAFRLILETPGMRFQGRVDLGDEERFEWIKIWFKGRMKDSLKTHGDHHLEIRITPLPLQQDEYEDEYEEDPRF